MYKILADENIPFAKEAFSNFGSVQLVSGREITNELLRPFDFLIIRSITQVNKELLEGTNIRYVGTTTIGIDHLDTEYLKKKQIGYANAPGCNADSVAEYIFAALFELACTDAFILNNKSIGIIGHGNIGSRVARIASAIGMRVYINDPPLERKTGDSIFCSYREATNADIVTYHVPLNKGGEDNTFHMLSSTQFASFNSSKIILNASRGGVVSNNDLKNFLKKDENKVILDVWENEPQIDRELLKLVWLGTSHIAGYSLEGKVNGTTMIFNSLNNFLGENKLWSPAMPEINNSVINYPEEGSQERSLNEFISGIYNTREDDIRLRGVFEKDANESGDYFDHLRKNYPVRREFSNYTIRINKKLESEKKILKALRFKLIEY